jgi:hypothetical protein
MKTIHHSTLVGRFTDDESTLYTISTSASVIMSHRHRGLMDDLDRGAGDVMNGMPPEYLLWYGHTCILTRKRYACGHTTKVLFIAQWTAGAVPRGVQALARQRPSSRMMRLVSSAQHAKHPSRVPLKMAQKRQWRKKGKRRQTGKGRLRDMPGGILIRGRRK